MRDIALAFLFPILFYYAVKRPFIGLSLWLWSSLVPINTWAYGFSTSIRWNLIFALTTIIGYSLSKHKPKFQGDLLFTLILVFAFHMTLSSIMHNSNDIVVWREYEFFIKAIVFFVFACLIVEKPLHFEGLLWACTLSIGAKACIEGMKFIHSGGGHVVRPLSTQFSDNNLGALASLIVIPLMMYLYTRYQHKIVKLGLGSFIFLNVMFIIGSDSRGGFVGLLALGAYFFWKSKRKLVVSLLIMVFGILVLQFADQDWLERMQTINEATEDGSFMSRIMAWKLSIILAINHPVFGGGFNAVAWGPTWLGLLQQFSMLDFIPTPVPSSIYVAHSIYFQVLGDVGFVGFFWYTSILWFTFRGLTVVRKKSLEPWVASLAVYTQLSFVAFLVAGAALSSPYNDLFLLMVAITILLKRRLLKEKVTNPDVIGGTPRVSRKQ